MPPPRKPKVNFGLSPSPALSDPGRVMACCGCGGVPAVAAGGTRAGCSDMVGCCWGGMKAVMVVTRKRARTMKLTGARREMVKDAGVVM